MGTLSSSTVPRITPVNLLHNILLITLGNTNIKYILPLPPPPKNISFFLLNPRNKTSLWITNCWNNYTSHRLLWFYTINIQSIRVIKQKCCRDLIDFVTYSTYLPFNPIFKYNDTLDVEYSSNTVSVSI